jgi:hypothetical protein
MQLYKLERKLMIVPTVALIGMSLAGCAPSTKIASLQDDASKIFTEPPCAVESTTRQGQRWVNDTTESGIAALSWNRPKKACEPDKPTSKAAPVKATPVKTPKRRWLPFFGRAG